MTTDEKIIKTKVGVLRLAEQLVRISVKAHSLNGGCRTVFERRRLTEKFYIKCATSSAAI
jgi:hypothetical protein